jgi:flavin reductase (DIM6/NTAB) family NADH-FMN oxidoreductase RutF
MKSTREGKRGSRPRKAIPETISGMEEMEIGKAFTLMESGPVVLVTTHDGNKNNIMTISWTMVVDFTPYSP